LGDFWKKNILPFSQEVVKGGEDRYKRGVSREEEGESPFGSDWGSREKKYKEGGQV